MLSLNRAFQLLNLKNDALRKRYDGIKYDMKRIEEIMYDVTVHDVRVCDLPEVTQAGIESRGRPLFIECFMPHD